MACVWVLVVFNKGKSNICSDRYSQEDSSQGLLETSISNYSLLAAIWENQI